MMMSWTVWPKLLVLHMLAAEVNSSGFAPAVVSDHPCMCWSSNACAMWVGLVCGSVQTTSRQGLCAWHGSLICISTLPPASQHQ